MYLTIHKPSGLIVSTITDMMCVPSQRKINELADAGYLFEVDCVAFSKSQVRKACKESSEGNCVGVPEDMKRYIANDIARTEELVKRELNKSDSREMELIGSVIGV